MLVREEDTGERQQQTLRVKGIQAALASALFLGMAPIFGKQAILSGMPFLQVAALRTLFAALLLVIVMLLFQRKFLYIYPAGLLGCLLAGGINGFGSLLYYGALNRIDAGLGQMLYALYPLFVAVWLRLDHQPLSKLTQTRLAIAIPAIYLITQTQHNQVDWAGVLMMLGAAALYALHLPINQRVLYDMPAPTVTLYTLIAMSLVVGPALLFSAIPAFLHSAIRPAPPTAAWGALAGLTLVTFLSRLTLFLGVKHLGGMQTAILGLSELVVTVVFAHLVLAERLTALQWVGMALLVLILLLVRGEKAPAKRDMSRGWLRWLRPPGLMEVDWRAPE